MAVDNPIALFAGQIAGDMREKVLRLEDELRKHPQLEQKLAHHFSDGIYARELFIPKGAILTGKIHRHAHLNIIPVGDIMVMTEHGVKRITGPCTLQSFPGIKRAGYALEDTIWITIHPNPTNERDMEKLEAQFIVPSFEALEAQTVLEDQLT